MQWNSRSAETRTKIIIEAQSIRVCHGTPLVAHMLHLQQRHFIVHFTFKSTISVLSVKCYAVLTCRRPIQPANHSHLRSRVSNRTEHLNQFHVFLCAATVAVRGVVPKNVSRTQIVCMLIINPCICTVCINNHYLNASDTSAHIKTNK